MGEDVFNDRALNRRGFLAAAAGAAATAAATMGPWAARAPAEDLGCAEHLAEIPKIRRGSIMYTMPALAWNTEAAFLDHIAFMKSLNCNAWEFAGSYPTVNGVGLGTPAGWAKFGEYANSYGFRIVGTHDGPAPTNAANLGSAITKMNGWQCNQLGAGSGWPGIPGAGTPITNPATISAWQASCATMNAWGKAYQTGNGAGIIPTPYGNGLYQGQPVAGRPCARYYRHFHSEQGKWITGTGTKYDQNYISALAYTELDTAYAYAQSDQCWLLEGLWMSGGGPSIGLQGAGDPNPGQGRNRLVQPDIVERWQDRIITFHIKDLGPTDQGTQVANIGDNSGPGSATAPFGALPWAPNQDTVPYPEIFSRLRHPECHEFLFERDGFSGTVTSSAYYKKLYVQAFDMYDKILLDRTQTRAPFQIPTTDAEWAAIRVTGIGGTNRPPANGGAPGPQCSPHLNGVAKVGQTLQVAGRGTWSRIDNKQANYSYMWLRDGAPLPEYNGAPLGEGDCDCRGTGERKYTIQPDDEGHVVSCQVTVYNADDAAATSMVTNTVTVQGAPGRPGKPEKSDTQEDDVETVDALQVSVAEN